MDTELDLLENIYQHGEEPLDLLRTFGIFIGICNKPNTEFESVDDSMSKRFCISAKTCRSWLQEKAENGDRRMLDGKDGAKEVLSELRDTVNVMILDKQIYPFYISYN